MASFSEIRRHGILVGIDICVGEASVFIDRPYSLTEEEVKDFISSIITDSELCINEGGLVQISRGIVLQIGNILSQSISPRNSLVQLSGNLNPNVNISALRDDGTIGKSNWRFELLQFGKQIFPQGILSGNKVVYMPGMGREEFNLWKNFGVHSKDMVMIEGNPEIYTELRRKYENNGSTPSYVNSYLGEGNEVFPQELITVLGGKKVNVLSLDTESGLSRGLYIDLLGVFSHLEIGADVLFMLNIVRRNSAGFAQQLVGKMAEDIDVIDSAMRTIPQLLIRDSERMDCNIKSIKTGMYLGGSSTPMHFVFAHIKKKSGM